MFVFGDVPVMLSDYIILRYFCFSVSLFNFLFVYSDLNSIIIISARDYSFEISLYLIYSGCSYCFLIIGYLVFIQVFDV